jgi:hypothetical protein
MFMFVGMPLAIPMPIPMLFPYVLTPIPPYHTPVPMVNGTEPAE